jgi:ankyrin repeat protein
VDLKVPINTNVGKYGNPLAAAAKYGEYETVKMLLEHGADVNQRGGKYGTPLQAACCGFRDAAYRHSELIIQMLLERKADVNATGGKYGSALQAAAWHNHAWVEVLLKHGADPGAVGGKYGSPLKAALEKKSYRAERALRQAGAME